MSARGLLLVLLVLVAAGGGAAALLRCEGSPPEVRAAEPLAVGREPRSLVLELGDTGSGLRDVSVGIVVQGKEQPLLVQHWSGSWLRGGRPGTERLEVPLDPKALGVKEGDTTLHVVAHDWSWRGFFAGNETSVDLPVSVDLHAPRISIENGLTYLERGGSGLVAYQIDEPVIRDGVEVAGVFFPGYPAPGGGKRRLALFAIPQDAPPDPPIQVVAVDRVGNRSAVGWATRLKERGFPDVELNLPPSFMQRKVPELAQAVGIEVGDPVPTFQRINSEIRAANEKKIRDVLHQADRSSEKLWDGAFEQLRNSKVTSHFAERRSYFVDGQKISQATHYGYDLATLANGPITASNRGRVVYADDLGIYGNCVLIDHGMGLTSLYGHLSRIDVKPGDSVEKGQQLGVSGQTGLAGGDHLHFAILVGDVYVDPVEWWDPKWVREKIDAVYAPEAAPSAAAAPPAAPPERGARRARGARRP